MLKFQEYQYYLNEQNLIKFYEIINEKLITFGNKEPKYNNIVIMMGGAASGKGYIINNLVGLEGIIFDVDKLKALSLRSTKIRQKILDQTGKDISSLSLSEPEHVTFLHNAIHDLGIMDKKLITFLSSVFINNYKPNIIFDVTLRDLNKLENIYHQVTEFGYKKENIHLVWVVNDIETTLAQNSERDRKVSSDILISVHRSVATTANLIMNKTVSLSNYMDGDFWIVFNKRGIDSITQVSDKGGFYIKDALYVKVKEQNKEMKDISEIEDDILEKLEKYTKVKFKN